MSWRKERLDSFLQLASPELTVLDRAREPLRIGLGSYRGHLLVTRIHGTGKNVHAAILLTPIEKALRQAQFRTDCAGKLVILEFDFHIDGDPYDRQTQEVAFGYPNRFWITARPPVPINEP